MQLRIEHRAREAWAVTTMAAKRFRRIEGTNWADSLAFNAFFSLFPMIILFVTVASFFVEKNTASHAIIAYVEGYIPLDGEMRERIFGAVTTVVEAREQAGVVAFLFLLWNAVQTFTTLIRVTNRAWGDEAYKWWRLPLRGILLVGVTGLAVIVGMVAPAVASFARLWLLPKNELGGWIYSAWSFVVPLIALFISLTLFYRLAPIRKTRVAEVWVGAASATVLIHATEFLFSIYLKHFATLSAVYGIFGGIMAMLLWMFLTGCGFIFGTCVCASLAERRSTRTAAALRVPAVVAKALPSHSPSPSEAAAT